MLYLRVILCFLCCVSFVSAEDGIYSPPYAIAVGSVPQEKLTFKTPWYVMVNGRPQNASVDHLVKWHGYKASDLAGLNYDQLNRIHGWEHTHGKATVTVAVNSQQNEGAVYEYQTQCDGKSCRRVRVRIR